MISVGAGLGASDVAVMLASGAVGLLLLGWGSLRRRRRSRRLDRALLRVRRRTVILGNGWVLESLVAGDQVLGCRVRRAHAVRHAAHRLPRGGAA